MLYVIPIEPLEERYSAQWLKWTQEYLSGQDIEHHIINPQNSLYDKIENGAFLDVVKTNRYKNDQMSIILTLFDMGKIKDGDIFWFHDMWFPGLEMLAYIRDGLGLKIKIYGCLHAGTYDSHDFTTKKGMRSWGHFLEASWFKIVDGIFVATQFHKDLIMASTTWNRSNRIHVTGFPMYAEDFAHTHKTFETRDNIVVFPHRLDDEKQPWLFDQFAKYMYGCYKWPRDDWSFVKTKEVCQTKEQYYDLLRRAKYAVSFARQETWGIAMQEAVLCGCIPVVPDRLSYSEMYPKHFKFNGSMEDAVEEAAAILGVTSMTDLQPEGIVKAELERLQNRFAADGREAFENMMDIMGLI